MVFPESGRFNPAETLKRVDLPDPDLLTNVTNPCDHD
jgi:hypothetical protein